MMSSPQNDRLKYWGLTDHATRRGQFNETIATRAAVDRLSVSKPFEILWPTFEFLDLELRSFAPKAFICAYSIAFSRHSTGETTWPS